MNLERAIWLGAGIVLVLGIIFFWLISPGSNMVSDGVRGLKRVCN
jgi:hypothetical protein